jgi:spore maturation protein CgeB
VKILLVSNHNPHFMTNVEYMHKALGQAGHEVSFFDDRAYWIPGWRRVAFSDADDLKEKPRHYLQRGDQRTAIALEGCREGLEKHIYRHRIRKILDHVSAGGVS